MEAIDQIDSTLLFALRQISNMGFISQVSNSMFCSFEFVDELGQVGKNNGNVLELLVKSVYNLCSKTAPKSDVVPNSN